MSKREKRTQLELDYNVLHNTGGKVEKSRGNIIDCLSSSFENLRTNSMDHLSCVKSKEKKFVVKIKNIKEPSELKSLCEIKEYRRT